MTDHNLSQELYKACTAKAPKELILSSDLDNEIEIVQEYLGRKFNNLQIDKKLEGKVSACGYSLEQGFDEWLSNRISFYKSKWEQMTQCNGEILTNHDFISQTFNILNRCSWWVQNAYQPYSGAKELLHELDCIASCLEQNERNGGILREKAKRLCSQKKSWHGKRQQELKASDREIERQIFSFFAELKAAQKLLKNGFTNICFLPENNGRKTPDLSARKDGKTYYIEVKRIQNPREEDEALRSSGVHSGVVIASFRGPLQKKIGDFICDAKEKFNQQDQNLQKEQKILILDFNPGIDARLNVNFNATLNDIFSEKYFNQLERTHDITIWPRKFF